MLQPLHAGGWGVIESFYSVLMQIDTTKKRAATRVMPGSQADDQLLYFTSPSLTADDRHLVFIRDCGGHPNLFAHDFASGGERQLTDNTEGFLKSYVYFDGNPYRGLGKASVSLDVHNGLVYYIQGRRICVSSLEGERRVLAEYPAGQMTAYTHLSADGRLLCVPTTDARALDGDTRLERRPEYGIDERIRAEGLSSYIRIYDTATGREVACERVPRAWVTHVQFSPRDSSLLLYNHEWTVADCGIRRLWMWDGHRHTPLRTAEDGRDRTDPVTHEMWERDGKGIIYHGCHVRSASPEFSNLQQFVGRVNPDGSDPVEITLPRPWGRYGHYTNGNAGDLVTDGYYEESGDAMPEKKTWGWINGGAWISYLKVDWPNRSIHWVPLCRHGSSWSWQDCHPHPIFNHAGDAIYFTSDEGGRRAIYRVEVPLVL